MALHLTFIMAICLLAAERLDHLNGTSYACCTIDSEHYLCLDSLPSAEVFEGLPTGWNFTPQIGFFFFWHRAHALMALFSIFDDLLISWLQARIVCLSTRRLHSSIALLVRGPLAPL